MTTDSPADSERPRAVVEEFFRRMADDDRRQTVGELFAQDATITLPGARFGGPDAPSAFLAHLTPRYEWAAKEHDRWIEAENSVVSLGTLYGVDSDGGSFDDVRYVDVCEIEAGEITRLDIWNDLLVEGVVD